MMSCTVKAERQKRNVTNFFAEDNGCFTDVVSSRTLDSKMKRIVQSPLLTNQDYVGTDEMRSQVCDESPNIPQSAVRSFCDKIKTDLSLSQTYSTLGFAG